MASRPISVVHTGVKSVGWEKRMDHLSFFQAWNESNLPCVVSIAKSTGTTLPSRSPPSVDPSG
eukprot:4799634-Prymnesium_polylepis.1